MHRLRGVSITFCISFAVHRCILSYIASVISLVPSGVFVVVVVIIVN